MIQCLLCNATSEILFGCITAKQDTIAEFYKSFFNDSFKLSMERISGSLYFT